MLFSTFVTALSVLAAVAPADASTGLRRRRCSAKPGLGSGGGVVNVGTSPTSSPEDAPKTTSSPKPSGGCFPSAGFDVPDSPKGIAIKDWWCSRESEYAFMGFSYAINSCPSKATMTKDFKRIRSDFKGRYIRTYGGCDQSGFASKMVDAAYEAGVGVFALVWFGFNGDDSYKRRLNDILDAVEDNDRAPYVIRTITIGSEAIFDHAISTGGLVDTIKSVRNRVKSKGIEVSTSEMPYLLKQNGNVLDAVDHVELNSLPFFSGSATYGSNARSQVVGDLSSMAKATGNNKKVFMTQTGWPSDESTWKANSRSAVASVDSEKAYFDLLDDLCPTFKDGPDGGSGWFAHIYDDNMLGGWGILRNGSPKFKFNPRTKC